MPISVSPAQPTALTPATRARELSTLIKQRALAEGFEMVGIVPAEILHGPRRRLEEWLDRGYHGAMQWMTRDPEMRTDPRKLFPQARSVIVVAKNYYTPSKHTEDPATGKVSRYAWGDDYHDVVGSGLKSLLAWIQAEVPGADGKVCVDIQPMMDKA